jgi:hypothetical protein
MAVRIATSARNAAADALVDLIDAGPAAGYVEIRTGSQPATANTAASGTLLVTATLGDPAFGAAASGVATANAIGSATGVAAGTAGWFRTYDSTGAAVHDGSVTATGGGGDMTINTTTISVGLTVNITAYTVTMPAG